MSRVRSSPFALSWLVAAALLAGCGGSKSVATTSSAQSTTSASAPGALQGEAAQAAAGDIPDNQAFVVYEGNAFSIKAPEGWARTGSGGNITFRDKNNIVRVVIQRGPPPTAATVRSELAGLTGARVTKQPVALKLGSQPAIRATYEATSAPNAVTGKRVTLTVDRYVLGSGGRRAVVDLGSPVGVDNVDAYRLMITSFRLK